MRTRLYFFMSFNRFYLKILSNTTNQPTELYRSDYWPTLLQALITAFEMPPDNTILEGDDFVEIENVIGYQAAYSQLNYAKLAVIDPIPDVQDGCKYLAQSLAKLSVSRPGDIPTLISGLPGDHQQALQRYCAKSEARIV